MVSYFYFIDEMEQDIYASQEKDLRLVYEAMGLKKSIGLTNAINISKNNSVVTALKANDREIAINGVASLNSIVKKLEKLMV